MPSNQPDRTVAGAAAAAVATGGRRGGVLAGQKGPAAATLPVAGHNFDNFIIDKIPPKLPARALNFPVNPLARAASPAADAAAAAATATGHRLLPTARRTHAHSLCAAFKAVACRTAAASIPLAVSPSARIFGKFKSDLIYVANYKIPL